MFTKFLKTVIIGLTLRHWLWLIVATVIQTTIALLIHDAEDKKNGIIE